jgi:hypothetical protein
MKKAVLTFGLLSGLVLAVEMLATLPFLDAMGHGMLGYVVGYTTMVLAFLLVYFGVRTYRDNALGGSIGFGRAFGVGMLIVLVSSACYVATWELVYFKLRPDFGTKYAQATIDKARASGASEEVIAKKTKEARDFAAMYDNPLVNIGFTLLEPLPPGLVVALVSAGVLRRKRRSDGALATRPVTVV